MRNAVFVLIFLFCALALADTTDIAPPVTPKVGEKPKIISPESLSVIPDLQKVQEKPKVIPPESLLIPPPAVQVGEKQKIVPQESLATSPSLPSVQGKEKIVPEETSLAPPSPVDVTERQKAILPESLLLSPTLPDVQKKGKNVQQEEILQSPDFQSVQGVEPSVPSYEPLQAPSFNEVSLPQIAELNDFKGGLDLVSFPTHIGKDCAIELENAFWNAEGEMYKRPGYSLHSETPEVFNFLYRYYQEDGDAYLMGGSDTALYYYDEDSSDWFYLIGTEGTSGRWNGTTFENLFVGVHEGIIPLTWDGDILTEIGFVIGDSLKAKNIKGWQCPADTTQCAPCSLVVEFDNPGWVADEWKEYTVAYRPIISFSPLTLDTILTHDIICGNSETELYIRTWSACGVLSNSINHYFWISGLFGIDTVWREGTIDDVSLCTYYPFTRIVDSSYYWDSTFSYRNYIFEVTEGLEKNAKVWMLNYDCLDSYCPLGWDTLGFMIDAYNQYCFEAGSKYRIYKPTFTGKGAKFVENFDNCLWLASVGVDEERNKNKIIYNDLNDIGDFRPENFIVFESPSGDEITGMIPFYSDQGGFRSSPLHELVVFQNNAIYKIFPSGDGYDNAYIASGVGCCSNASIVSIEGRFLGFADQHGVYAYDGNKVIEKPLSAKVDPIFKSWNLAELEDASAVFNPKDRHYCLSYPGLFDPYGNISGRLGGIVVAWDDDRNAPPSADSFPNIYVQIYSSFTTPEGENIQISDDIDSTFQARPEVESDKDNNFVIAWEDSRNEAISGADIYAQKCDPQGNLMGSNFKVNSVTTYRQSIPKIGMDRFGNYVIVWKDYKLDYTGEIYAKKYNASGFSDEFRVNDDTGSSNQINPDVALSPLGKYAITFQNYPLDHDEIWAKAYQANGDSLGPMFEVTSGEVSIARYPKIAMDYANNFVIAWEDDRFGTSHDIYAQRYNSGAIAQGSNFRVNSDTTNIQQAPAIGMDAWGNFIVVWRDGRDGNTYDLYAQRYDPNGNTIGSEFVINDTSGGGLSLTQFDLDMDGEGNFVVVWADNRSGNFDIYMRAYNSSAELIDSTIKVNNDAGSRDQMHPAVSIVSGRVSYLSTANNNTLAWSIDFGGWSTESFNASAYCYQHSLSDTVKILFADPSEPYVYYYGTQTDDVDEAVILTYQSPYFRFSPYPWQRALISYATFESYSDSGILIVDWINDYGTLIAEDTLTISGYDLQTIDQNGIIEGNNISLKLRMTGNDYKFSGYWLEYLLDKSRR